MTSIPPINLNNLEHDQIAESIKTYIKSKSDFTDFDFEGSALSTLIDVLAYNTHYHTLFQNILVNEMFIDSSQKLESIISHAKLHGYTVPNKLSATATLTLTGIQADSGAVAYSRLTATKSDNTVVNFYNIEDVIAQDNDGAYEATFTVYEARRAVIDQRLSVNVDKQSCFIPDTDLDIRTLSVYVDEVKYEKSDSAAITDTRKKYFLENTASGFNLIFPSYIENQNDVELTTDTVVTVSYLVSSGSSGNGASSFSFFGTPTVPSSATNDISGGLINVSAVSGGGQSTPSLDNLKFLVPRTFASQGRLVTKNDMIAAIVEAGYASSSENVTILTNMDDDTIPAGTIQVSTDVYPNDSTPAGVLLELLRTNSTLGLIFTQPSGG